MKNKFIIQFVCGLIITTGLFAQTPICNNKTFSTALLFDPTSIAGCTNATSCGGSTQVFDNRPTGACAETEPLDACAPAPSTACVGTQATGYDLWFKFYATSTGTANINLNPQIAFTATIQAFSGSTCVQIPLQIW